jgi:hypothetical protein
MRNKSITALLMAISFSSSANAMSYPQELLGWWSPSTCSASTEAFKATDTWMGFTIFEKEGYWNEQVNCTPTKIEKDKNNNYKISETCDVEGEGFKRNATYAVSGNNLVITDKSDKRNPISKYLKCESPLKKGNKK